MTDAPNRIWVVPEFADTLAGLPGSPYDSRLFAPYILATPEALSAAPEVKAIIAAAVADAIEAFGRDVAGGVYLNVRICCDGRECGCQGSTTGDYVEHCAKEKAAAIRAGKP
jgi:hypothetical protein